MLNWLAEFHRELLRVPATERVTILEHCKILESIAANDAAGAESVMSAHLTRASELYRTQPGGGIVKP